MSISAKLVMELRDRTSAGMMDCKKALLQTNGDIEAAILEIRKAGLIKAEKKVDRLAAEGVITVASSADGHDAVIIEINSETDFVARDSNFVHFVEAVSQTALAAKTQSLDALKAVKLLGAEESVDEARQHLMIKIGENIQLRRLISLHAEAVVGAYLHGSRIGVLVSLSKGDAHVAKDIAMHIAASRPVVVRPEEVSAELIAKERSIYSAQAEESGKPPAIIEKMIEGRVQKFLSEVSLLGQPFVKNPDQTVAQYLKEHDAVVETFVRFEVGEGIEKGQNNFVEEVMAQVREKS